MGLIIKVPIRPFLFNYVYFKTNTHHGEPIDLSRHDAAVYMLEFLLRGKQAAELRGDQRIAEDYSELLPIRIQERKFARYRYFVNDGAIVRYNVFLNKFFLEDLHAFVVGKLSHGAEIKEAIGCYMNLLKIEDLIEFDTVTKAYQRFKKRKGIDHKQLTKMSRTLQAL